MVGKVTDQMIAVIEISVYTGGFAFVILHSALFYLIAVEIDMVVKGQIGIALRKIGKLVFPIGLSRNGRRIDQLVVAVQLDRDTLGTLAVAVIIIVPGLFTGKRDMRYLSLGRNRKIILRDILGACFRD